MSQTHFFRALVRVDDSPFKVRWTEELYSSVQVAWDVLGSTFVCLEEEPSATIDEESDDAG